MFGASSIRGKEIIYAYKLRYFLIPHCQLHAVLDFSIGTIRWSHHAPVVLTYALSDTPFSKTRSWKLNASLLQDPEILADVVRELEFYFQTNVTHESNSGIVWEALKRLLEEY